tara:strand:+ start:5425 stop:6414 length:990 start_codon:yes stop_codon:yes gene_type:complete
MKFVNSPFYANAKKLGWVKLCFMLMVLCGSVNTFAAEFAEHRSEFSFSLNERVVSFDSTFQMVLPGEELVIKFAAEKDLNNYELLGATIPLKSQAGIIRYLSPVKPGYYPLEVKNNSTGKSVQLHLFVLVPITQVKKGVLNAYKIGDYPPPHKGLEAYKAPLGYIEVYKENESIQISPHFTLGQFLCKQQSGYPKYLVLRPRLVEKLELFLADVNQQGIRTDSFVIMSGYRTPYYNRSIGNVSSSRHMYGGAADIYIDVNPVNVYMDDVNGDGKNNFQDAVFLYELADGLSRRYHREDLVGGLGKYQSNANHGPFIHIDVRGSKARWSN